ncbi:MAG: hypothetical protein JWN41_1585 [Thermoleophilia bacterium]|nr:hypothetical protein [Thermoleophilia bacterium]
MFTSRAHGNLGTNVGDDRANVLGRRRALAESLGLRPSAVASVHQVHGADVWLDLAHTAHRVSTDVRWSEAASTVDADALVTTRPHIALAVSVADCLPIALVWGNAVAAIHAGWRGLAQGVIEATFAVTRRAAGSTVALAGAAPRAVIGPALRRCCFEVGRDVAEHFPDTCSDHSDGDARLHFDAVDEARHRLEKLDVVVDVIDVCTRCDAQQRLFSHRADPHASGRQALVVWRDEATEAH